MSEPIAPTDAQQQALARLVSAGALSAEQARAVQGALWGPSGAPSRATSAVLIEVAGYVGGALMLGGAFVLVTSTWERLSRAQGVGLLAAAALVLALAGMLAAGGPQHLGRLRHLVPVRRRLVAVLFALSAVPVTFAVPVALEDHAGESAMVLAGGLAGLVVAAAGYAAVPTAPGLLMTAGMSGVTAWAVASFAAERSQTLATVVAFVALGLLWVAASLLGPVRPRGLGLTIGAAYAIAGAQIALAYDDPLAYGLTLAAGVGCFVLYWWERATVLLVAGVIASTIAITEAVSDWTDNAMGGSLVVLVGGAVLVAASLLGLRLRRIRPAGPELPTHPPAQGPRPPDGGSDR